MYFWISICLDVQTQCLVFFHYVPRFFLKYKMFLLEICVLVLAKKHFTRCITDIKASWGVHAAADWVQQEETRHLNDGMICIK